MDKLMKQALDKHKIVRYIPVFVDVMNTYKTLLEAENQALRQPPVIGSFSLPELWKMAQKYSCDDFVKMAEEVNRLNDL
jgi:hypothetical protein